jgi:hypothetical protein
MSRTPFARLLIAFLSLTSIITGICAQDEPPPIVSDRPTDASSSYTVAFNSILLESGAKYSSEEQSGDSFVKTKGFTTPLLLRYGLLENVELRVSTDGVSWQNQRSLAAGGDLSEKSTTGFASPGLGFKWQINDPEGDSYEPSIGFLFDWDLPIGSEAFRPEKSEIELTGLADFPLPANFGLTVNGGVTWPYDADTERRYTQGSGAIVLSNSISDRAGLFGEVYIDSPTSDGGHEEIWVDGGVTYLVAPSYQIDFAVFKGVGRVSSDWAVTGGLTFYISDGT